MPDSRVSGSSTSWIVPPHGSPKRRASSAETPYVTTSHFVARWPSRRVRSTMSSSMQPPETEPTTYPSSRTASIAPSGRGELPHVLTTVTSSVRRPSSTQSAHLRRTSRSTLSMPVTPSASTIALPIQRDQHDHDRDDRRIANPGRAARRREPRRCRDGRGGGRPPRRRTDALDKPGEEIVGHLRGRSVDEPRADLRELAAHLRLRGVVQRRLPL